MPLSKLSAEDRIRLIRFACSFAWADLRVVDEERTMVRDLVRRLNLDDDEAERVEEWLESPPGEDLLDPGEIPREHVQLFLRHAEAIIGVDGVVDEVENESLALLRELLTAEAE